MKWGCIRRMFALAVGLLSVQSWAGSTVNLTVNGKVVAKPCVVSFPAQTTDLGALDSLVSFPGGVSEWKNFTFTLTGCPVGTTIVTGAFSGNADGDYYSNSGSARGIILEIQDDSGNIMSPRKLTTLNVDNTSRQAIKTFKARARIKNGSVIDEGSIKAVITVTWTSS